MEDIFQRKVAKSQRRKDGKKHFAPLRYIRNPQSAIGGASRFRRAAIRPYIPYHTRSSIELKPGMSTGKDG
jgi:hypothetical protein